MIIVFLMIVAAIAGSVVTMIVTDEDDDGKDGNRVPVATATADMLAVDVNEIITFNASGSADPDGDELTVAWYFGDGSEIGTDMVETHAYADSGTYRVLLIVSDGELEDSANLEVQVGLKDTRLKLNEIMFNPEGADAGGEWVELYNTGETAVDLEEWTISASDGSVVATLPDWDLPEDSYVVVLFGTGTDDSDFTDGTGEYHTGLEESVFNNTEDECGLYSGNPGTSTIVDFVSWSFQEPYGPGTSHDHAIQGGIWTQNDVYLGCPYCDDDIGCIGRDADSTDTDRSDDWFRDGGINTQRPTPGKDNDAMNIYDRTIAGTVSDTQGDPLPDVNVSIPQTGETVRTTVDGSYFLMDPPVGETQVVFTKEEYVVNTRIVPVTNHDRSLYDVTLVLEEPGVSIDKYGGSVYGKGDTKVEIPAGAVDTATSVSITPIPASSFPETAGNEEVIVLNAVSLGPAGATFNQPVNVSVPLVYLGNDIIPEAIKAGTFNISYFNVTTLSWVAAGTASLDPGGTSVTYQVSHFSVIRTTTFWYYWYIEIQDDGNYIDNEGTYEGNAYCGGTFSRTISKTTSVTISGEIGVGYGPVNAKIGATVGESKTVSITHSFTAGPCEELMIYSKMRYKRWSGQSWKAARRVGSAIYEGTWDWIYQGTFVIYVPIGLRVYFVRVDRTEECCPETASRTEDPSSCGIDDSDGDGIGDAEINVGETTNMYAVGYDSQGDSTGPLTVRWSWEGSDDISVSHIGESFSFTPLGEGTGVITISDGYGLTSSTGTIQAVQRIETVRINEVMYDPEGGDAGKEWMEIYHAGTGTQGVMGWTVSDSLGTSLATLPDLSLPADCYLVVHFGTGTNDLDFTDGTASYYTGTDAEVFSNTGDECALYTGSPSVGTMVDFVSWAGEDGYVPGAAHNMAVDAGMWTSDDNLQVCSLCMFEGESIGRDADSTDTDSSADWYSEGGVNTHFPTPGKDNDALNIYDRSISGTVTDPAMNPLPGVKVWIPESGDETYTDAFGEYYLMDVPVGEVPREIPLVYETGGHVINSRIVPVSNHDPSIYNVVLEPMDTVTTIGPAGGTIETDDGITVVIPAGALDTDTDISVTLISPEAFPEILEDNEPLVLNGVSFSPDGLVFDLPITVNVPIEYLGDEIVTDALKDGTFGYSYLDDASLSWVYGGDATVDLSTLSIIYELDHFSVVRTTTFWYHWYIEIQDDGNYEDTEGTYEGNAYCGGTFSRTISKTTSVTISGEIGAGYGPVNAKIGASVGESNTVSITHTFTAGPCEELMIYSKVQYKRWSGRSWKAARRVGSAIYEGTWDWIYQGTFVIYVPTGLRVYFERVDRTEECCPESTAQRPDTSDCGVEDEDGYVIGDGSMGVGDTMVMVATGYDTNGDSTGPLTVRWTWQGTGDLSVSHIGETFTFMPGNTGSGSIYIDDGMGHTASTGIITVDEDTESPWIMGNHPISGETEIPVDTYFRVDFSEPMDADSVEASFIMSPATEVEFLWNDEGTQLVVLPAGSLEYNTDYKFTIGTEASDLAGNPLETQYEVMFSTEEEVDTEPPLVEATMPVDGEENVPVDTTIKISFTEEMDKVSVENAIHVNPDFVYEYFWNPEGTSITLDPIGDLSPVTTYTVQVDETASDLAGNPISSLFQFSFTTA